MNKTRLKKRKREISETGQKVKKRKLDLTQTQLIIRQKTDELVTVQHVFIEAPLYTEKCRADSHVVKSQQEIKQNKLCLDSCIKPLKTKQIKPHLPIFSKIAGSTLHSRQFFSHEQYFYCRWCVESWFNGGPGSKLDLKNFIFNHGEIFKSHLAVYHHDIFFPDHECDISCRLKKKKTNFGQNSIYKYLTTKKINETHRFFKEMYICHVKGCNCPLINLDSLLDHFLRLHPKLIIFQTSNGVKDLLKTFSKPTELL